jgi:hypothetical protein
METTSIDERRKYPRFSDRILAGAAVQLKPVAPFYGEPASGYLIDLSGGGMALVLSDLIPKNVFLQMTMTLPDGFVISSVITVRRIVRQGNHNDFVHGIEFLNPAPEMVEHIESMAKDVLACNGRTKAGEKEICVTSCSLAGICKRPQRIVKDVQPALIEFTEALKSEPSKPLMIPGTEDTLPEDVVEVMTEVTPEEIEKFWKNAA